MNLIGSAIGCWIAAQYTRQMFNFEAPPADEAAWILIGEVVREEHGVGLWLSLFSVSFPGAEEPFRLDSRVQLIPWPAIRTAIILESVETPIRRIGFEPPPAERS